MITILTLISRPEYIDKLFASLEGLECNPKETNLLTVVDGDSSLFIVVRNKTELSKFKEKLCVQYKDGDRLNYDVLRRRKRIANIHNFAKQFINNSDYVMGIEDDTEFYSSALKRLYKDCTLYPFAGTVSGVQAGRWGYEIIGAWRVNQIYEPIEIKSIGYSTGIEEVDASGMYLFMTKTEIYKRHDFKPYDQILGPDFDFGLSLRQQGHSNYVDFNVITVHKAPKGDIKVSRNPDIVAFTKADGRWRQRSNE